MITNKHLIQLNQEIEVCPRLKLNEIKTDDSRKLQERLKLLKEKKITCELDKPISTVNQIKYSHTKHELSIAVEPGLFPIEYLQENFPKKFFHPPLSVIVHFYSGKESSKPEFYFLQRRGLKTIQGKGKINWAAAGFVQWSEHPSETAKREFIEETR